MLILRLTSETEYTRFSSKQATMRIAQGPNEGPCRRPKTATQLHQKRHTRQPRKLTRHDPLRRTTRQSILHLSAPSLAMRRDTKSLIFLLFTLQDVTGITVHSFHLRPLSPLGENSSNQNQFPEPLANGVGQGSRKQRAVSFTLPMWIRARWMDS